MMFTKAPNHQIHDSTMRHKLNKPASRLLGAETIMVEGSKRGIAKQRPRSEMVIYMYGNTSNKT